MSSLSGYAPFDRLRVTVNKKVHVNKVVTVVTLSLSKCDYSPLPN